MLDPISKDIERYMDLVSARQKLVSTNVANAATPGYKTRDIDFQTEFRNALDGTKPDIVEPRGLKSRNDGNNVSMDRELRLLSENAIRFNVASSLWKGAYRQVKAAIQEGKNG
jgi:flagellar basal-body rod protein FlgB